MPDILDVFSRRWKLILALTLTATLLAFVASVLSPKQFVGVATALPANTLVNDKARIFNKNIEALYSEIGTADELDKLEGTAKLDTIFIAVATDLNLAAHYKLDTTKGDVVDKAANGLRKNSNISRTGYGELKIKVWDTDALVAATAANLLMQKINEIHQRIQSESNTMVLQKLKEAYMAKQKALQENESSISQDSSGNDAIDTAALSSQPLQSDPSALMTQIKEYSQLINEYELLLQTTPKALLVVEQARPSPWHDRPKTMQTVMLALLAAFFFSFLLAILVEGRRKNQ